MLTGASKSKEDNQTFKQEISNQLTDTSITFKQEQFEKSLSTMSKELMSELSKLASKIEFPEMSSASQTAMACAKTNNEVQSGMLLPQKDLSN